MDIFDYLALLVIILVCATFFTKNGSPLGSFIAWSTVAGITLILIKIATSA